MKRHLSTPFAAEFALLVQFVGPLVSRLRRQQPTRLELLIFPSLLFSFLLALPTVSNAQQLNIPDPINENVNTLCTSSLDLGSLTTPFARDAELQNSGPTGRANFFRFNAVPGTELEVSLTGLLSNNNSTPDPYLGWFNSDCQLLAINDDAGSLDSFLIVTVPDDGVLVLAATTCCDSTFSGEFDSSEINYRISIGVPPPSIGTLYLEIQNALTFETLRGNDVPYAFAELYRCELDCDQFIGSLGANDDGQLAFNGYDFNPRLTPGTYLLRARAEGFGSNESGRFTVSANGSVVITIGLDPPPISLAQQLPCENLPPQGGLCSYSVVLNNNTDRALSALMWSVVSGYGLGSPHGSTQFEAAKESMDTLNEPRAPQLIPAYSAGAEIAFSFEVPSTVPQGAQFCQSLYIGLDPSPLVNTLEEQSLFCIEKLPNRFKMSTGAAMANMQGNGDDRKTQKRLSSHGLSH